MAGLILQGPKSHFYRQKAVKVLFEISQFPSNKLVQTRRTRRRWRFAISFTRDRFAFFIFTMRGGTEELSPNNVVVLKTCQRCCYPDCLTLPIVGRYLFSFWFIYLFFTLRACCQNNKHIDVYVKFSFLFALRPKVQVHWRWVFRDSYNLKHELFH